MSELRQKRFKVNFESCGDKRLQKIWFGITSEDNLVTIRDFKSFLALKMSIEWPMDVMLDNALINDWTSMAIIANNEEISIRRKQLTTDSVDNRPGVSSSNGPIVPLLAKAMTASEESTSASSSVSSATSVSPTERSIHLTSEPKPKSQRLSNLRTNFLAEEMASHMKAMKDLSDKRQSLIKSELKIDGKSKSDTKPTVSFAIDSKRKPLTRIKSKANKWVKRVDTSDKPMAKRTAKVPKKFEEFDYVFK